MVGARAATLTSNVARLVLHEPPVDPAALLPAGFLERLDDRVADGEAETVVESFGREVLHMGDSQIEDDRSQPSCVSARDRSAHPPA